ncbi:hypothetical protein [Nostoc sp. LEGE 06077]|nr:hypothetical protein [Nostoc sp. LEGE 06077]
MEPISLIIAALSAGAIALEVFPKCDRTLGKHYRRYSFRVTP